MQSITRNLEMAENRLSAEKMFSPSASPAPPYLYFLIYNEKKKKEPLSNLKSLAAPALKRKKKKNHDTTQHARADCESPSQYGNTIVFHVLINSKPPQVCLSADIFPPKPGQIAVSRGVTKQRRDVTYLDEQRQVSGAERRRGKKGEVEEEEGEGEKSAAGGGDGGGGGLLRERGMQYNV